MEETTSELVKERELFYFRQFKTSCIVLFNHCIVSSDGGVDSKSNTTRTYIFDILDKRVTEGKSYKQLAKEHKTSSATLLRYVKEWEELRGMKMPESVQIESTLERLERFVKDYHLGLSPKYREYGLSTQALWKHLPSFGLSFEDVRLDKSFKSTKERALRAVWDVRDGAAIKDSCVKHNISLTTYYKYANTID